MRNELGDRYVPCEVSSRWLQFPKKVTSQQYVIVDVMTRNSEGNPKKICELVLSKKDLLNAVAMLDTKDEI